jgi:hypothetical protein
MRRPPTYNSYYGAGFGKKHFKGLEKKIHKHIDKIFAHAKKHTAAGHRHVRKNGKRGAAQAKRDVKREITAAHKEAKGGFFSHHAMFKKALTASIKKKGSGMTVGAGGKGLSKNMLTMVSGMQQALGGHSRPSYYSRKRGGGTKVGAGINVGAGAKKKRRAGAGTNVGAGKKRAIWDLTRPKRRSYGHRTAEQEKRLGEYEGKKRDKRIMARMNARYKAMARLQP